MSNNVSPSLNSTLLVYEYEIKSPKQKYAYKSILFLHSMQLELEF